MTNSGAFAPFLNEIQRLETERLIEDAITAHFLAELAAQEALCAEAIGLTPRERWPHLILINMGINLADDGPMLWPSVACSWPDPIEGSRLADFARLSVGEG